MTTTNKNQTGRPAIDSLWKLLLLFVLLQSPSGCNHSENQATASQTSIEEAGETDSAEAEEDEHSDEEEGEFCEEHQVPEHVCGICRPDDAASLSVGDEMLVRFESAESVSKAGLETVRPHPASSTESLRVVSEVRYNGNKLARITPIVSGIVNEVRVDVGQTITADEALVRLHSPEIASAKAAYISAVVDSAFKEKECRRERKLAKKQITSTRDVQLAEAACKTASLAVNMSKQKLKNFGLSDAAISQIVKEQDASALITLRAPFTGTIVKRAAVVGEAIDPGDVLFEIADLSTMWIALSIPPSKASGISVGMPMEASFGQSDAVRLRGHITWIAAALDENSRMLHARAAVENTDRQLKAGMFGHARIQIAGHTGEVFALPAESLQQFKGDPYVFIGQEEDLFSLRRVAVHRTEDEQVIVSGIEPTENVVATGAFTAMSEFLKSRLGAGCVDD